MMQSRRIIRPLAVLGCTAMLAVGCGGGDEVVPPGPDANPSGIDTSGAVGGTGTATPGVTDPAAGGAAPSASAKLPDLKGGDVQGAGIGGGGGGGLFDALAGGPQPAETVDTTPTLPTSTMPTTPTVPTTPTPTVAAPTFTGAAIYVDGTVYNVEKGESFPKDEPIFKLVGVSAKSIELELVAGEFTSGGGDGVFLDKGDLVSLVNASEQVTYKVKFLRPTEGAVTGIGL